MERTGHHSTDGIRVYKRSSIEQQQAISDILSRSKKQKVDNPVQDDACTSRSSICPLNTHNPCL